MQQESSPQNLPRIANEDCVCSYFASFSCTVPTDCYLSKIIEIIRSDDALRDRTYRHRQAFAMGNEKKSRFEKMRCPAFTPAVRCVGGKRREHIASFTGLGLVDVDHVEAERMEELFARVCADPHTVAAYRTVSGRGIRVIWKIKDIAAEGCRDVRSVRPEVAADAPAKLMTEGNKDKSKEVAAEGCRDVRSVRPEVAAESHRQKPSATNEQDFALYKAAFAMANDYYSALLGMETDRQCKNPERISGMAHDAEAYLATEVLPFVVDLAAEKAKTPAGKRMHRATGGKKTGRPRVRYSAEEVGEYAERWVEQTQRMLYLQGQRNGYVSRVAYKMNRLGVPREEAMSWLLLRYPDLPVAEVEGIATSVYSHTEEHDTERMRQPQGERGEGRPRKPSLKSVAAYLADRYSSRLNLYTDRCEIRAVEAWPDGVEVTEEWTPMTDRLLDTIRLAMSNDGMEVPAADVRAVLNSTFSERYNPMTSYIARQAPWSETEEDYIGQLARRVMVQGDKAFFADCLRKWFVSFVRSAMEDDYVNHSVLCFIGRQGCYKTTFFRFLLPPELRCYTYTMCKNERYNKDDFFTIAESLLVLLEEIDQMRPAELNQMKAMVTMESVNERRAYGIYKERRPRRASFCATGNNTHFLTDLTGNRRWLSFLVEDILPPQESEIDYGRLYAQAKWLIDSGFQSWFSAEEVEQINRHNTTFEAPCAERELFFTYFRLQPLHIGELPQYYSVSELIETMGIRTKGALSGRVLALILQQYGVVSVKRHNTVCYRVFLKELEEIEAEKRKTESEQMTDQRDFCEGAGRPDGVLRG